MHILLTRPLKDSRELILKFQKLGHNVSHLPLISIEKKNHEKINFSEFKSIIFTSSNSINFLDTKLIDKKIICFCVGSATETVAKKFGYQNIYSASGNVNNLKEIILQNFKTSEGKLLYVSGEIISVELDRELIKENYSIERLIVYRAKKVDKFEDNLIEQLKKNMPEIVYIYSQSSAASFLDLIKNYNLKNHWMNTNLMCLGEKTSSVLNEIKWKKIFLFNPGEEEFLLYKI